MTLRLSKISAALLMMLVWLCALGAWAQVGDLPSQVGVSTSPAPAGQTVLALSSVPSGAQVFLGATALGTTPIVRTLPPGPALITVTHEGYAASSFTMELSGGLRYSTTVTLEHNTGSLVVKVGVEGAVVRVGASESTVGSEGSVRFDGVPVGRQWVIVQEPSHMDWTVEIGVETNRTTTATASLTLKPATLTITSEPTGALVKLDGTSIGTTPIYHHQVTPAKHDIEIVRDHYQTDSFQVELAVGEARTVKRELARKKGSLSFSVVPPTATVIVDGRSYSLDRAGNVTIDGFPPGDYKVRVEAEDHHPYEFVAEVADDALKAELVLTAIPARVLVITTPEGAEVWVNGTKLAGLTPLTAQVPGGFIQVRVVRAGYKDGMDLLEVSAGHEYRIDFDLVTR